MTTAIDLITHFEGCRLTAYKCPAGVWTIGYGQTGNHIHEGSTITQEQADAWLAETVAHVERGVLGLTKNVALSANQLAALTSFTYNVGIGALSESTLLRRINSNMPNEAADEFLRWDKVNGHPLPGLTARRVAERTLFLTPVAPASPV